MSRFFTDADEREPIYEFDPNEVISDTPPNVVWIRPRMNLAQRSKAQAAAFGIDKTSGEVEADFGRNAIVLAQLNILDWEGPDFVDANGKKIPVNRANIERLVGADPFIARVLDEIAKRNNPKKSPDPKSPATNGSTSDGATSLSIPTSVTAS